MVDRKAFFSLSYGMYVISAVDNGKQAGCIVNTFNQVTSSPARVSVTLWVPVNDYDLLSSEQVEAVVEYDPAQPDKDLPVLVTKFPNNARVKQVSPATLQYVILHN